MAWIKIFISHSTKTPEARAFLDAVKAALSDQDFEVPVDDNLLGGENWRDKIYDWMDEAHGAVLLLTRAALASEFVPIEASVLAWRAFRQPDFAMVPVLLETARDDLQTGVIGRLGLERFELCAGTDPAEVAQAIVERLTVLRRRLARPWTPREKLLQTIVDLLREQFSAPVLRQTGANPHAGFWTYAQAPGDEALSAEFAAKLCAAPFERMCAVAASLGNTHREAKAALEILDWLAPMAVPENAATPLSRVAQRPPGPLRAALFETESEWLPRVYISRAHYRSLAHGFHVCPTGPVAFDGEGPGALEKAASALERQIVDSYRSGRGQRDEIVKRQWALREREAHPVYVRFNWGIDWDLLDELHRRLPTLTFLILATDDTQIAEAAARNISLFPSQLDWIDAEAIYFNAAQELDGKFAHR